MERARLAFGQRRNRDLVTTKHETNKIYRDKREFIHLNTNATTIWIDNDVKCEAILCRLHRDSVLPMALTNWNGHAGNVHCIVIYCNTFGSHNIQFDRMLRLVFTQFSLVESKWKKKRQILSKNINFATRNDANCNVLRKTQSRFVIQVELGKNSGLLEV